MAIPLHVVKAVLKEAKQAKNWDAVKEVYEKFNLGSYDNKDKAGRAVFSSSYNRITGHLQREQIKKMKVGEKTTLYLSQDDDAVKRIYSQYENRYGHPFIFGKVQSECYYKVTTWVGQKIGRITNMSWFKSGGFAPCKRVSVTFVYLGMTFRGVCSYENMQCFNVKRVA